MKKFEQLSFIKSKLYEKGQATLSAWADGSSEVLSSLLGVPLSWEYEVEPVFKPENSHVISVVQLPAKGTEGLVSKRLHEIFNLKLRSEISTSRYDIKFELQTSQDPTLFIEFRSITAVILLVPLERKTFLTINLYPILYDRKENVWLNSFKITYTYKEKELIFEKINALYSGVKPKDLSSKEIENMLKLTREFLPSLSETLFAFLESTDVKTLGYGKTSDSDIERISYAFFIPSESLELQGLVLNWGFSVSLVRSKSK